MIKSEYIIYSKVDCSSCTKALDLLKKYDKEYMYLILDVNFTLQDLFKLCPKPPRSFPVILKDGLHLGGLKELREHLGENNG